MNQAQRDIRRNIALKRSAISHRQLWATTSCYNCDSPLDFFGNSPRSKPVPWVKKLGPWLTWWSNWQTCLVRQDLKDVGCLIPSCYNLNFQKQKKSLRYFGLPYQPLEQLDMRTLVSLVGHGKIDLWMSVGNSYSSRHNLPLPVYRLFIYIRSHAALLSIKSC